MKKFRNTLVVGCSLLFFSLFFGSCNDDYVSSIPDFPVYLSLNLATQYPNFRTPYQTLTFVQPVVYTDRVGFGGILICVSPNAESTATFTYYAYDMACPYEANRTVRVYPNDKGEAVCEKCGSVYNIVWGLGNPISGPSKEILKRYKTTLSGDVLYVVR